VVAAAHGGLPDVVEDGVSGILVAPGDATALRGALERLVDDPALRARMGEAARLRAQRFSAGEVLPRLERIYETVTSR
jgi:glycosyltransferase involved in cell wall biosynthesis